MIIPLIIQNALAVTFRIIVLPTAQGINKPCQSKPPQDQRNRDKIRQDRHDRTRSAFKDTVIDELDIASAAINGVANPAAANGTAKML